MSITDDDIIKHRLLIEGDGGSDDRRINTTVKAFLKWSHDPNENEEIHGLEQRLLSNLGMVEGAMAKSCQIYNMNLKERQNYDKLNEQIAKQIEDAYTEIAECKEELHQAKRVRRNRQEYDALAKVIQQQPDRQDTLKKLEDLDKEIESTSGSGKELDQKLEKRKKQFHVLMAAIYEMQRILEADNETAPEEDGVSMDTT